MAQDETTPDPFTNMFEAQAKLARTMMAPFAGSGQSPAPAHDDPAQWGAVAHRLQTMWLDFQAEQAGAPQAVVATWADPAHWAGWTQRWLRQMPMLDPEKQKALWDESLSVWSQVLGQYAPNMHAPAEADRAPSADALPRQDKRFADDSWRAHPAFALIHQTYLLLAERLADMAEAQEQLPPKLREQHRFFTRAMTDANSPANYPWLNPVVLQRTLDTGGENLVKGMEHLLRDLRKGQLTHTDADAFKGVRTSR